MIEAAFDAMDHDLTPSDARFASWKASPQRFDVAHHLRSLREYEREAERLLRNGDPEMELPYVARRIDGHAIRAIVAALLRLDEPSWTARFRMSRCGTLPAVCDALCSACQWTSSDLFPAHVVAVIPCETLALGTGLGTDLGTGLVQVTPTVDGRRVVVDTELLRTAGATHARVSWRRGVPIVEPYTEGAR